MRLYLQRVKTCSHYILGHLYINNIRFCDTLESINGLTAGIYEINLSKLNERYKGKGWARRGKVPAIVRNGFKDTLIFIGTSATDNLILVGNRSKGNLILDSQLVFSKLLDQLTNVFEKITLTIE